MEMSDFDLIRPARKRKLEISLRSILRGVKWVSWKLYPIVNTLCTDLKKIEEK